MDEDPTESEEQAPPSPQKPSQVPSWVMLGFVLGGLFVWALPGRQPAAPAPVPAEVPRAAPAAPRLTTIEAVFEAWGQYAAWNNDTTEVALWSGDTKSYSDCYEVARVGTVYYFRSIPSLTQPVLAHGVPEGSPLEFTETPEQRERWLADVRTENAKAFTEGLKSTFGTPPPAAPK